MGIIEDAIKNQKEVEKEKERERQRIHSQQSSEPVEPRVKEKNTENQEDISKIQTNEPRKEFEEVPKNNSEKSFKKSQVKKSVKDITREDFIKWFYELDKDSGDIAGGKGANLGEMYNNRIPVPTGFVVTAQAYDYFIRAAGIKDKIKEILDSIDYENSRELNHATEKIRKLIIGSNIPKEMQEEIREAYEHLDTPEVDSYGRGGETALDILQGSSEPVFVAVRSSATTENLTEASFAGQQDTYLNVKGEQDLIKNVKKCFASLFTARATYYKNRKGFPHQKSRLAVVVQKMIDSKKSGVSFSKDPTGKTDDVIIEASWGLGEGVVSGKVTPDRYIVSKTMDIKDKKIAEKKIAITRRASGEKAVVRVNEEKSKQQVLTDHEIKRIAEISLRLEDHYQKSQDVEFAIENEDINIVQTRPITTLKKDKKSEDEQKISGEEIISGLGASPRVAVGKVKIIENPDDLDKIREGDILVTGMTNPDIVIAMQKSSGVITNEGGMTAHAAIVSREMGIPCIVGTGNATEILSEGDEITLDANSGKVFKGRIAEETKKEIRAVETKPKTEIKVMVDLPGFAKRAAKTNLDKVGLTRIEGIIAESGKHPQYFINQRAVKEYEDLIYKGISNIAEYFNEMWVRTSDIRTNEYKNLEGAPQESEDNPMLGLHGVRYGLKNPGILKAELKAMNRAAKDKETKIGFLLPQIISVEELREVKKFLNEMEISNLKIGVIIETPASVQIIKSLCEEGLDFISFGTNDLTQYILAVDKENSEIQELYDEMHPAIIRQLGFVIRVCKRAGVETSICGRAGSKKPMVKYLVKQGIDSISVNADIAAEIAGYVSALEQGKDPDKEKNIENKKENTEKKSEEDYVKGEEAIKRTGEEKEKYEESSQESHSPKPENPQQNQENKQKQSKDIQAIEKEKQEYESSHSQENEDKKEAVEATEREKQQYEKNMYSGEKDKTGEINSKNNQKNNDFINNRELEELEKQKNKAKESGQKFSAQINPPEEVEKNIEALNKEKQEYESSHSQENENKKDEKGPLESNEEHNKTEDKKYPDEELQYKEPQYKTYYAENLEEEVKDNDFPESEEEKEKEEGYEEEIDGEENSNESSEEGYEESERDEEGYKENENSEEEGMGIFN